MKEVTSIIQNQNKTISNGVNGKTLLWQAKYNLLKEKTDSSSKLLDFKIITEDQSMIFYVILFETS